MRSCSLNAKSGKQAMDENELRKVHAVSVNSSCLFIHEAIQTPAFKISMHPLEFTLFSQELKAQGSTSKRACMEEEFHIGHRIKEHIDSHGIKLQWLSRQLYVHRNTLYNIFERKWIDSDLLMRFSIVLERDFFAEFSEEYARKMELKKKQQ